MLELLVAPADLADAEFEAARPLYIMILIFVVPMALVAVLMLTILRPWLRAMSLGLDVTAFELAGMRLRRIPIHQVLDAMQLAQERGIEISQLDVQRAYRPGVDLDAMVIAYAKALDENEQVTFEQIVQRELAQ